MAIPITDKFKPKGVGGYPLMDAVDVEMPDGTRLSDFKGVVTSVNGQTGDVTISAINGKDGQDGKDGKDGVSPSVTITAITGGYRVTISDATGTKSFDVMDGEDGQDGDSASITVDSELSETSENPVQNKVIVAELSTLVQEFGTALGELSQAIPTEEQVNALIDAKLANFLNVAEVGM